MAGRYIPPAQRRITEQSQSPSSTKNDLGSEKGEADGTAFTQRSLSQLRISARPLHSIQEICYSFGDKLIHSTLHDSQERPGELAFLVLFNNANPRWDAEHIIFAHTNVDILPGYQDFKKDLDSARKPFSVETGRDIFENESGGVRSENPQLGANGSDATSPDSNHEAVVKVKLPGAGSYTKEDAPPDVISTSNNIDSIHPKSPEELPSSTNHLPIPVFAETRKPKGDTRRFEFAGYFRIARLEFLRPHSPELVRMLEQKWQRTQSHRAKFQDARNTPSTRQRDAARWNESLNQIWAVIQMEALAKDECPPDPQIKQLEDEPPATNVTDAMANGSSRETSSQEPKQSHTDVTEENDIEAAAATGANGVGN